MIRWAPFVSLVGQKSFQLAAAVAHEGPECRRVGDAAQPPWPGRIAASREVPARPDLSSRSNWTKTPLAPPLCPALSLCLGNPSPASLRVWPGREAAMEVAPMIE